MSVLEFWRRGPFQVWDLAELSSTNLSMCIAIRVQAVIKEMSLSDCWSSPSGQAKRDTHSDGDNQEAGLASSKFPGSGPLEVLSWRLSSLSTLRPTFPSGPSSPVSPIGPPAPYTFCRMPIWATQCSFFNLFSILFSVCLDKLFNCPIGILTFLDWTQLPCPCYFNRHLRKTLD